MHALTGLPAPQTHAEGLLRLLAEEKKKKVFCISKKKKKQHTKEKQTTIDLPQKVHS